MDGEEGSVPWVFMAGSVFINVPNLRLFLGLGSSVLGLGVLGEAFIALGIGVMGEAFLALEDGFDLFFRDV